MSQHKRKIQYPKTRTTNASIKSKDTVVPDPYRWLEAVESPEVIRWTKQQNQLSANILKESRGHKELFELLTQISSYTQRQCPQYIHDRYYFEERSANSEQGILMSSKSLNGSAIVVLDPHEYSTDNNIVSLEYWKISPNGRYIAFFLRINGSDIGTCRIRNLKTGEDLPTCINTACLTSHLFWNHDSKGIFLEVRTRELSQNVYYALTDTRVQAVQGYHTDNREYFLSNEVVENPTYHFGWYPQSTHFSDENVEIVWVSEYGPKSINFKSGTDKVKFYRQVHKDGGDFYLLTDDQAPRTRLIRINWYSADPNKMVTKVLIDECADILQNAVVADGKIFASYLSNVQAKLKVFSLTGQFIKEIPLPPNSSLSSMSLGKDNTEVFIKIEQFTAPATIYRLDVATLKLSIWHQAKTGINPDDYMVKQVFYPSETGDAQIPLFICHRKDLVPSKQTPCLMHAYGGHGIPTTPGFSSQSLAWMKLGGVFAVAGVRGGGEYGWDWYNAGRRESKQNTFSDLIAGAQYLISKGYTSSARLAVDGASSGGLTVAASILRRPDLFGAALVRAGNLDLLKGHPYCLWNGTYPQDYGNPNDENDFQMLLAYSPVSNVKDNVRYPSTFVVVSDNDDRVAPSHSYKFAALLQNKQCKTTGNLALLRVEHNTGHGHGQPKSMGIQEHADCLAFLYIAMGLS